MKLFAPIALAVMLASPSAAVHAEPIDHTRAGVEAAERWLAVLDAGRGADAWSAAAASLRAAVTQEQLASGLAAARAPFGAFKSRKLANARYTTTLPGAPPGEYVVIQFESTFDRRAGAIETVTPMREADGSWKVSGYFIR